MVFAVVWREGGWFDSFLAESVGADEGELGAGEVAYSLLLNRTVVTELVLLPKDVANAHCEDVVLGYLVGVSYWRFVACDIAGGSTHRGVCITLLRC